MLISISLFVYSALSLGYVFATQPLHLILTRLVLGAAGAMVIPISMAYVGDFSPEGQEGRWMGYANATFLVGWG